MHYECAQNVLKKRGNAPRFVGELMFALLNLFEELKYCSMLLIQEYIGGQA